MQTYFNRLKLHILKTFAFDCLGPSRGCTHYHLLFSVDLSMLTSHTAEERTSTFAGQGSVRWTRTAQRHSASTTSTSPPPNIKDNKLISLPKTTQVHCYDYLLSVNNIKKHVDVATLTLAVCLQFWSTSVKRAGFRIESSR